MFEFQVKLLKVKYFLLPNNHFHSGFYNCTEFSFFSGNKNGIFILLYFCFCLSAPDEIVSFYSPEYAKINFEKLFLSLSIDNILFLIACILTERRLNFWTFFGSKISLAMCFVVEYQLGFWKICKHDLGRWWQWGKTKWSKWWKCVRLARFWLPLFQTCVVAVVGGERVILCLNWDLFIIIIFHYIWDFQKMVVQSKTFAFRK